MERDAENAARRLPGGRAAGGFLAAALTCASLAVAAGGFGSGEPAPTPNVDAHVDFRSAPGRPGSEGCLRCHDGIEDMHPSAELSCTDCHGGDPEAVKKFDAHVHSQVKDEGDERVDQLDVDLAYRRFVNPMDLRVVDRTCGECHSDLVHDLSISLHGTTAGHVSDGFYEMGITKERGSKYAIFPVKDSAAEEGEVDELYQTPAFKNHRPKDDLATHFPDLVRKECMQCHLYSEGRALRGRVGFDGDYRGQGCAACHVPYGLDGLSDSADRNIDRNEPGHPWRHVMTKAPTTQTCTSCHYGDASIGLHFRGLSQLPPGAPGGPEIDGTLDAALNRQFYLNDASMVPPDVHHEMGMHCVDCHTLGDVMGDGQLHGQMEHAVEISCEACHGTFDERSKLRTERGTPLEHLFQEGDDVYMRSKVTGKAHRIRQVVDVLDPKHPDYNEEAAKAMTRHHGGLECYTCHAGWNVNFLGFHFYRNEALSQLDLLSGQRTPGRVTTQEKVFATWKSFYAGRNETGRVAPYLTGFSTMGTVDGADGQRILDQVMPVTAEGLSGMTMVHHQLHSTRPTARSCVECHRTSSTWGMGSGNFKLARQLAFVADRRGIEVVAVNRANLASSTPIAKVVLPDVVDLVIQSEPLQGSAEYLYAAEGGRGIHVIDVRDPAHPTRVAFIESVRPRGMALAGNYLYSADGIGGLRIYDVTKPEKIERIGVVPMFDAHEVEVRWPYAYVADGPGGLAIVDVRAPISPKVVGGITLVSGRDAVDNAVDLDVLFQYSRPEADSDGRPSPFRSKARNICAVIDEDAGLILVDVTEATHPRILFPRGMNGRTEARRGRTFQFRGIAVKSHVDLASPQGGDRTEERDYAYMLEERLLGNGQARSFLRTVDITDPRNPASVGRVESGNATEMLSHAAFYNQPFLQPVALVPGELGVYATDLSVSSAPSPLGAFQSIRNAYVVAIEEFPLDKMIDEDGKRLKDISRDDSRWMYRAEIERILDVSGFALGTVTEESGAPPVPGASARAFFKQHDYDKSGLLNGEEYDAAGGETADRNGDGRITLAEVAEMGRTFTSDTTSAPEYEGPVFLETRVDPDGDLARLLDGVNPYEFDRDDDYRLDRKEAEKAVFTALDLDRDKRLSFAELSRHPGALRQLRYGDLGALARFGKKDLNRRGTISLREFNLRDVDWEALDADNDGGVQLPVDPNPWWEQRGFVGPQSEWPTRQPQYTGLPPVISNDRLQEVFDKDGDYQLTKRELKGRPDLFMEMDRNGDGVVDRTEYGRRVALVTNGGVEVTADDFTLRWDLDGDGKVSGDELSEAARLVLERAERR